MQRIIEEVNYFACGSCKNHLHWMFKNVRKETRTFPAGVFLIKHQTQGYVLYDTGYTTDLYKNSPKYLLYRLLNPIQVSVDQMIDQQLRQRGIQPSEIKWLILSHLHPDHIGGVKQFPNATFIVTESVYRNFKHTSFKDLIFKELLPRDFEARLRVISPDHYHEQFPYQKVADLFGDESMLVSSFDGHAIGQGCLFLPEKNLFIGADICWGIDLLQKTDQLRPLPRLIQNDMSIYQRSCMILQHIKADGIEVMVSHDLPQRIEGILT